MTALCHPLNPRCIRWLLILQAILLAACSDLNLSNYIDPANNPENVVPAFATDSANEAPTDNISADSLRISPPAFLTQARMVDPEALEPIVRVIPGGEVAMTTTDNAQWTGVINVVSNSTVSISIEWLERLPSGINLTLASLERSIPIGTNPEIFTPASSEYRIDHDDDEDGVYNLIERRESTNPLDANSASPPQPGSTEASVVIPLLNSGTLPQIDGLGATYDANELRLIGEWAEAAQESSSGDLFIDSLMVTDSDDPEDPEPFHAWAASHDGSYLYLLVMVDDSSANTGDSQNIADDDSIEIFIDGNNSNLVSYGDADDRYFRLALLDGSGEANNSASPTARLSAGQNGAPVPTNIEYAVGLATGPLSIANLGERLDVYEVKLELASFNITVGQPFGIEVQVNDDDDGGGRDEKWGWIHPQKRGSDLDLTVNNPAFMGTAVLSQ